MLTPLTAATKTAFIYRLNALTADSQPRFGKLNVSRMIVHLRVTLEFTLGEKEAVDRSTVFSRNVMCWLVYSVVPWPKGKIKVPDEFTPQAEHGFAEERASLFPIIDRFTVMAEKEPQRRTVHPMFGPLTMRYWQKVHGKHFDHHLKQFAV